MYIDIDDEVIDQIVSTTLKDNYDMFKKDKKSVFFSFDKDVEKAERKRYREAFALVHNWYTTPELHI